MLTTRDGPAVIDAKARYWSKIAIFCPSYAGPRRNISITCGYPDGEKNFQIDIFTQYENVTDRQRAMAQAALMHSIARQKNRCSVFAANFAFTAVCVCNNFFSPQCSQVRHKATYGCLDVGIHRDNEFVSGVVDQRR